MADYEFSPGQLILRQGEMSDFAYMILYGKVEVFYEREDGTEEHLAFLDAGKLVGEYGVLDNSARSASVRAVNRTTLRSMRLLREDESE